MSTAAGNELRPGCERRCPGCAHRHLSATDSGTRKRDWLTERLADWADKIQSLHGIDGEARWAYRDKVCLKCEWRCGSWQIGMNLGDEVIAIPDCPVHSKRVNATLHTLCEQLPGCDAFPLAWFVQSGAQVTLVLKTSLLPDSSWLNRRCISDLTNAGVEGLWLHLHPAAGKKIFNKPGWHLVWGQPRSVDRQGLHYGPVGFQQLIPDLYRQALYEAENHLHPLPDAMLIDLYSGSGATLKHWAKSGCATIGVELGSQACECAALNAPDIVTLRGKCAQRIPQLTEWAERREYRSRTRLLYVNPPRTGLEESVTDWIYQEYRPVRMAYLSCSAGTLYRDLAALTGNGYRVEKIIPYDFFPHTYHVETLALLEARPD
jgi:tRNA/tmRNA/rRNA uracil-C5-methylase (TrmA/RlmC/RlmD family)